MVKHGRRTSIRNSRATIQVLPSEENVHWRILSPFFHKTVRAPTSVNMK